MFLTLLIISAIATSSTGGNTVGAGGTVRTGASYSSAQVRTISSASTTSSVRVEASSNGVRRTTQIVRPPQATGTPASLSVSVIATSSATATPPMRPGKGLGAYVQSVVANMLRSIFSFLR